MELTADKLRQHDRYAIAYHPDGDGYGTINIFLNHLPNADYHIYSVDNSRRDFTPKQYTQLQRQMEEGYWVIYLDLTPSNREQLEDIAKQTQLLYLDHHQIAPEFREMFDRVYTHNPRMYDPSRAELYAAGLQIYHLFGGQTADLPYLFVSLFGDAKFNDWPEFGNQLQEHQEALAEMATALSIVGLTKPLGPYRPELTDKLFNEVIQSTRAAYREGGTAALLQAFHKTQLANDYQHLKRKIEHAAQDVYRHIEEENRVIRIEDANFALCAMLLKDAYYKLDFHGPFFLYQVDEAADLVSYAVMSKNSDYDCAGRIRQSPYVTGGGHTDRAGGTGSIEDLQRALDFFQQGVS